MPPNDPLFVPEVVQLIVSFIRAGAYPWVAAEAAGVPKETFESWLAWGKTAGGPAYAAFHQQVRRAAAQCRAKAEMALRESNPEFWLAHGPARERETLPGWSAVPKPAAGSHAESVSPLADPEFLQILAELHAQLKDYPEARGVLANFLARELPQRGGEGGMFPSSNGNET